MEFLPLNPPRIQTKVYFTSQEGGRPESGVYTVVATDDYAMAGYITVESEDGARYGVNGDQLELLEEDREFQVIELPEGIDGKTFLPSEDKLRAFGFTDHKKDRWYHTSRVGSGERFNLTIPKEPIGFVRGVPVYGYEELVMDENFGQPAYFGKMANEFRYPLAEAVSLMLGGFRSLGLNVFVDPLEYGWTEWFPNRKLRGDGEDQRSLEFLWDEAVKATQEAAGDDLSAPEQPLEVSLDPEILAQVGAIIDAEAENFSWDSLAHGMTMGQYVAPTAIRTYLEAMAAKEATA